MQVLDPGWDIRFSTPAEVGSSYEPFMKWQLHGTAAGSMLSYEALTGDLSDVNFSSIRSGPIEVRRIYAQLQTSFFVFQFCRPGWSG